MYSNLLTLYRVYFRFSFGKLHFNFKKLIISELFKYNRYFVRSIQGLTTKFINHVPVLTVAGRKHNSMLGGFDEL